MSWVNSGAFKIANRNNRHYVFRRNNAGNTEINIPKNVTTKAQAKVWLRAHPNKIAKPTRYRAKRPLVPAGPAFILHGSNKPWRPNISPIFNTRSPNFNTPKLYGSPAVQARQNRNTWNVTCPGLRTDIKTLKKIGSGRQGVVFMASKSAGGTNPFVIKVCPRDLLAAGRKEPQPVDVEFKIQKAAQKCSSKVVRVFKDMRCIDFVKPEQINAQNLQDPKRHDKSKQGLLIMEYCNGGNLDSWLNKTKQLNDTMMYHLISDILGALADIQSRYPYFRHNDLHMQNIFVAYRGFLIGDFGWARLERMGTNPAVNTANGTTTASNYGVGPNTDARYDHHLFLNELRQFAMKNPSKFPKAIAFLDKAIPAGYRGESDVHVKQFRLKYNDPCPGLPTLDAIMKFSFLRAKRPKSSNLVAGRAALKKTGRKLTPARNKSPSVKKLRITSANLKAARAKLKKTARKMTNAELLALSAVNFLKLSPGSRARLAALRTAAPKKKAAMANLTGRKKANATGGLVIAPKRKPLPPGLLKSNKFNKLVTKIYQNQNKRANESFNNAWNRARNKAINQVQQRVNANKPPFSPSPPKAKAKPPSPPKAKTLNFNYKLSPTSGRVKIKAPNSGRYVYANGQTISLAYLKSIANKMGVNVKGLRSKANIVKRIFSAKNK